jgi:hypothetical protein
MGRCLPEREGAGERSGRPGPTHLAPQGRRREIHVVVRNLGAGDVRKEFAVRLGPGSIGDLVLQRLGGCVEVGARIVWSASSSWVDP